MLQQRYVSNACIGLWVLKKSVLFLEFWVLNSVVELVGIALAPMKWRVPVLSLAD
jgi:hypothetical protein